MGRELDALEELEQQTYQLFHILAPEVDVALAEAVSAAAAGAEADGTEARLAEDELEALLRVVRRQLARHYADLCAELQADARPLGLQGELERLAECLVAVSGVDSPDARRTRWPPSSARRPSQSRPTLRAGRPCSPRWGSRARSCPTAASAPPRTPLRPGECPPEAVDGTWRLVPGGGRRRRVPRDQPP
ncbi:unnamed protein product [Prorocentrum cordatum]|uniref:Uncharacterized protein n=1 Tax=Prorocentrum cordatum TaxID=2364126 RepID=A0ABN9PDG4_9DINO|nr:unnamed protein product [Polarella glacialis]